MHPDFKKQPKTVEVRNFPHSILVNHDFSFRRSAVTSLWVVADVLHTASKHSQGGSNYATA